MQALIRFYERTDDGRRRILKTVDGGQLVAPHALADALSVASRVMAATEPALATRIVEVRVALVEQGAKVLTP
jgi:hypothetical protein